MNSGPAAKRERQRAIREIITTEPITSQQELPALDVRLVEGVNHYTIVFTDLGVSAVKDAVLESLRRADLLC